MRKGGFVLWEENKPNRTLDFDELVRMITEGEIEAPTISAEDINARVTRARGRIIFWLLFIPAVWFIGKFVHHRTEFQLLVVLAEVHGVLSWLALICRYDTIISVEEPAIVTRYPLEPQPTDVLDSDNGANECEADSCNSCGWTIAESAQAALEPDIEALVPSDRPDGSEQTPPAETVTTLRRWTRVLRDVAWNTLVEPPCAVFWAFTAPMQYLWDITHGPLVRIRNPIKPRDHYLTFDQGLVTVWGSIGMSFFTFLGWGVIWRDGSIFSSSMMQEVWSKASLFLCLQPFILVLVPRWVVRRVPKVVKVVAFVLYGLIYSTARLSIFLITFDSARRWLVFH